MANTWYRRKEMRKLTFRARGNETFSRIDWQRSQKVPERQEGDCRKLQLSLVVTGVNKWKMKIFKKEWIIRRRMW